MDKILIFTLIITAINAIGFTVTSVTSIIQAFASWSGVPIKTIKWLYRAIIIFLIFGVVSASASILLLFSSKSADSSSSISSPTATSTPTVASFSPTSSPQPTLIPTLTQRDPYTIEKPGDTYVADFTRRGLWQATYEWRLESGELIYTNFGNGTSSSALSPVNIKTPNYAIEADVMMTPTDWAVNQQGGIFSRGNLDHDYITGGTMEGKLFIGDCPQANCENNMEYYDANISKIRVILRLEVRGTLLTLYADGDKKLSITANSSNNAQKAGIFANGLQSMQIYSFKVKAL